ncbi:ABC transporter permease [Advenella alkanexedens]|nr:ABC transporter permease [Advenella alkanexedens]WKU20879.1 ABC transporter permease [Advenella alkanexedens]
MLGWQDVRQRYRRSALGPFWLTISMGIMISTMGLVFGQIFKSPLTEFLPFLSIGIILWGFISVSISEGCTSFIDAQAIIKQLPIPLFVHIIRTIWRNILILAHNIVIFPLIFIAVGKSLNLTMLISILGFLLLIINLTWITLLVGLLSARFRDLPQIIASILQVVFYLTPIIWMPSLLPQRANLYLLDINPVYHLLEIVRSPLLGNFPTITNWVVTLILALFGWTLTLVMYGRYKNRIAYWL